MENVSKRFDWQLQIYCQEWGRGMEQGVVEVCLQKTKWVKFLFHVSLWYLGTQYLSVPPPIKLPGLWLRFQGTWERDEGEKGSEGWWKVMIYTETNLRFFHLQCPISEWPHRYISCPLFKIPTRWLNIIMMQDISRFWKGKILSIS